MAYRVIFGFSLWEICYIILKFALTLQLGITSLSYTNGFCLVKVLQYNVDSAF